MQLDGAVSDLFAGARKRVPLDCGAWLLGGCALHEAPVLFSMIRGIAEQAPFRHLETPGGRRMSVAMTNAAAPAGSATAKDTAIRTGTRCREEPGHRCRHCFRLWRAVPRRWRVTVALRLTPVSSIAMRAAPASHFIKIATRLTSIHRSSRYHSG